MSSFHERQKSLFDQLKDAEEQYSFSKTNKAIDPPNYGEVDKRTYRRLKHEMKQFRGKESIFKKSDANIRECLKAKRVPDYMKNPQKWVHYSLEDVTPEQMSDATNRATAMALMKKLEEQEAANREMDQDSDEFVFKKPLFHLSTAMKKAPSPPDERAVVKQSKVIMPEYVVGMTKKKEKKDLIRPIRVKRNSTDNEKKNELKLNHLYNDDEEED